MEFTIEESTINLNENPFEQTSRKLVNSTDTSVTFSKAKLKVKKQLSLLKKTIHQFELSSKPTKHSKINNELVRIDKNRYIHRYPKDKKKKELTRNNSELPQTPIRLHRTIKNKKRLLINIIPNFSLIKDDQLKQVISKKNKIDITNQLHELQVALDNLALKNIEEHGNHFGDTSINLKNTGSESFASAAKNKLSLKDVRKAGRNRIIKGKRRSKVNRNVNTISKDGIDYWTTVHSIESKQGRLLYRPRNKARNCTFTSGPCGHHQLTVRALKDIGCNSKQCRKDRLIYKKSLKLSKKLLALNQKRLRKNGITKLEDYQKYLIHQQGAYGIKNIIAATQGKKILSNNIKKNMANNSPYSYRQLKRMGSKLAAKKFLRHWKHKWKNEQLLVIASVTKSTDSLINSRIVPTFSDKDINIALNIRF